MAAMTAGYNINPVVGGHAQFSKMPAATTRKLGEMSISKRVVLFCNGDRFFKGKKVFIIPSRYHNFSDFLNDLTGKLPNIASLPYGVRQIFSPATGRKIRNIGELSDGHGYVCAGFEQFRQMPYVAAGQELPPQAQHAVIASIAPVPDQQRQLQRSPRPAAARPPAATLDVSKRSKEVRASNTKPLPQKQQAADSSTSGAIDQTATDSSTAISSQRQDIVPSASLPQPSIAPSKQLESNSFDAKIANLQQPAVLYQSQQAAPSRTGVLPPSTDAIAPPGSKLFVVISNSIRPRRTVKVFLSTSPIIASMEQLFTELQHAFESADSVESSPSIRRIYSVRGVEVTSPADFFRADDHYIALGSEKFTTADLKEILAELFPDGTFPKGILKSWELHRARKQKQQQQPDGSSQQQQAVAQNKEPRVTTATGDGTATTAPPAKKLKVKQQQQPVATAPVAASVPPTTAAVRATGGDLKKKDSGFVDFLATGDSVSKADSPGSAMPAPPSSVPAALPSAQRQRSMSPQPSNQTSVEDAASTRQQLPPVIVAPPAPRLVVAPQVHAPVPTPKQPPASIIQHHHLPESPVSSEAVSPIPVIPAPASVMPTTTTAPPKTTWEVDPTLARVIAEQQRAPAVTGGIHQYAVLPEIGAPAQAAVVAPPPSKQPQAVDSPRVVAEVRPPQPVPQPQVVQQPPVEKPAPTSQVPRPKLEHAPLLVDGQPESRVRNGTAGSRSSSAAPGSASEPGRIVAGKMSRQLSRIDHITARFEYGKQLGDGNFAVVRRSKRRKTGKEFAIKIIDKLKLKGKFHMVESEIRIMRACDHANLVKLYEMYETDKEIYLVMELVPDGDLFDAITAAVKFSEPQGAKMISDLANGLFYLHSRRIVHRDLKPENLLVQRSASDATQITLKLADFGLAMEVSEPIYSVCGTPTYVAPEILSEKGYGVEVDCWALGVICYILLCGFPPFRSQKRRQSELFEQIKSGKFVFLSPYWDTVSTVAKELISKLLVVDARRRYTAIDVLCHPWILSQGGAIQLPTDVAGHRRALRKQLEDQAKLNLKNWLSMRHKFMAPTAGASQRANGTVGHNGLVAVNRPPSSRN